MVAHIAVATEDLDRLLGHPYRRLAGEELGHRAFSSSEGLAGHRHPRRSLIQQPGGVDARPHVGELESDGLMLDDRLAEASAHLCVVERILVGGASYADRLG